jgi:hypothetical protein
MSRSALERQEALRFQQQQQGMGQQVYSLEEEREVKSNELPM